MQVGMRFLDKYTAINFFYLFLIIQRFLALICIDRKMAPLKSDWQKDVVYLIQFPRARIVPTASPFSLKLETYLRMADIYYLV